MAQSSTQAPPTIDSYSDKDVALTKDWLTIRGNTYSVAEIKKVKIDHHSAWQNPAALLVGIAGALIRAYHPEIVVTLPSNYTVRLWQIFGMAMLGLFFWAGQKPAWLILHFPDRKVRVLERGSGELKVLKAKIDNARKASAVARTDGRTDGRG